MAFTSKMVIGIRHNCSDMPIRILLIILLVTLAVWAQDPELGHIEFFPHEAVLSVASPRPIDSAARTLARKYGIVINSEDPKYLYSGDTKDVTAEVCADHAPRHTGAYS
jgi:hypothetical protein